jgi:2-amino-4-hydroxy-6-hydroxymethyldihydropteridine diphosphokinase
MPNPPGRRRVWVGVGANLGDLAANVREAIERLAASPEFSSGRASSLYETAPWGKTDQPWFVNTVVELETEAAPDLVLDRLLAIEQAMGRQRRERWGPRVIDLDYLLDETETSAVPRLYLPHAEVENRAFVLVPLAELRPELVLPSGKNVRDRAAELAADQPLRRRDGVTIGAWP